MHRLCQKPLRFNSDHKFKIIQNMIAVQSFSNIMTLQCNKTFRNANVQAISTHNRTTWLLPRQSQKNLQQEVSSLAENSQKNSCSASGQHR